MVFKGDMVEVVNILVYLFDIDEWCGWVKVFKFVYDFVYNDNVGEGDIDFYVLLNIFFECKLENVVIIIDVDNIKCG